MPATYEPIATTTLGSASNSVTLSSIPSTFTDLRLVIVVTADSAGQDIGLRFNSDTGTNYSVTYLSGDGTFATSGRLSNFSNYRISHLGVYTDTSIPVTVQTDIFSYAGSTFKTGLSAASGDKNGSGYVARNVGLWRNTSAITSLTIFSGANFSIGSTFTLYGIKNA